MAGALEKSSEVMKYMQQLVKLPEIQATMQEMSKEMMKVCTAITPLIVHVLLIDSPGTSKPHVCQMVT